MVSVVEFGAVIDVRVNRRGPSRDVPVLYLLLLIVGHEIKFCAGIGQVVYLETVVIRHAGTI